MALPSNLSFFMSRLQGVSTSHFKIFPQSSDNASSGKIIRFEMPNNSLVNLKNLRLFFNASTANATANKGGRLPNDISSLIERVAVYMGGVLVQNSFNQYNTLVHAKAAIEGSKCDATYLTLKLSALNLITTVVLLLLGVLKNHILLLKMLSVSPTGKVF